MAVNAQLPLVWQLARIGLVSAAPDRLAGFYETALGFTRAGTAELGAPAASILAGWPVEGARVVTLRLGEEVVELVGFSPAGAATPGDVPGWSPLFQHCAIIVSDMEAAFARLSAQTGWHPITEGGPQRLPDASGGVTAFKFRDPEGHPLEFLAFPAGRVPAFWQSRAGGPFLGIDHSAISVADTEASRRFYARLGYRAAMGSHNHGPEQARLDGIADPDLAVTGLVLPGQGAPHIELLCYRDALRGAFDRTAPLPGPTDAVATRLVLAMRDRAALEAACAALSAHVVAPPATQGEQAAATLRDPDGHFLRLVAGV
ncbi:MAG TPA: VOC family protein [Methylorubrum populi]|uniref:VOC family protein n=1 Tax=Methylorubrum populi TaxID=223967 RepID=A0A921JGB2_9HYPH|nr:VOC family protein [Methylorubrum populi]